jgi:hypothetical protein
VSIHVLCESRDPLQTSQRVKVALNLCALVRVLALKFYRCVLDGQFAQCARSVLFALTFLSLALVQWSAGNVTHEALNARGYGLPYSKQLLDQYLCSDLLAQTLAL